MWVTVSAVSGSVLQGIGGHIAVSSFKKLISVYLRFNLKICDSFLPMGVTVLHSGKSETGKVDLGLNPSVPCGISVTKSYLMFLSLRMKPFLGHLGGSVSIRLGLKS